MEEPLPGIERCETGKAASPGEQQCQATPQAKKAPLRHRSYSSPIGRVSPATTTNPGAALRTEADPQAITQKRARISERLTQRFIKRGEARARRFQKFRPAEPACRSKKCNLACCNYLNTIDGGRRQEWLSDVRRIADDAWAQHGYDGEDVHICFGIQYLKGADLRIKGTRKRSKTRVKSSKPSYFLPCIGLRSVDDDPGDLDLQVSATYFAAVYGFSSNSRRCAKLCKIARGCTPIQHGVLRPRDVRPSHTKQLSGEEKAHIFLTLKEAPKELSHYQRFSSKNTTLYMARGATRAELWMTFCYRYDEGFARQCDRLFYWHTYTNPALKPIDEQIASDSAHELVTPKVSYNSFCAEVNSYDVKFQVKRVDTCEDCHAFRYVLQRPGIGDVQKAAVKKAFRLHLQSADQGYAARSADHRRDESDSSFFARGIDFGGGLRNPLTTLNMAFYNRILPLLNFIIAGPNNVDVYAWDERTAGKGVNEVLSCVRAWLRQLKLEHPEARHVVFWSDSCYGQSWNQFMTRFLSECCDPSSQHYVGLNNIELKTPAKGHSYLYPDRAVAQIKQRSRKLGDGIVANFITSQLPAKFEHQTWESCIVGYNGPNCTPWPPCTAKGTPFQLHKMSQADIFDFKTLFADTDSCRLRPSQKLVFKNRDGSQGGIFKISELCWLSASGDHPGEIFCKKDFTHDLLGLSWLHLPLYSPLRRQHTHKVTGVVTRRRPGITPDNIVQYRQHEEKLQNLQCYTELSPLPVLKVRDLWRLGQVLAPDDALKDIYPPPDPIELARATKKHRESLDSEIRAQTVPATLFQLAELGFAQRAEVLASDNASVLPADTATELLRQDFEHAVNLITSVASQREAAAAIETRHQVSRAKCSANTNEDVATGAVVAVHEFDLHDDVMITYDGRDIRVCVSRRIESKRGSGTRYDINFPGDQWELDSDGRKTGARITTLKGVPADRLALAPTRRCRRPRQRDW